MTYDLVIAYRICPFPSKNVVDFFKDDKYALSKLCLESFKHSLRGLHFKIYALLDNCPKEYEDLFTNNFKKEDLEIVRLTNYGNKNTFKKQIEILSTQNESEIVYFAEDDYFYREDIGNMLDFLKDEADFVTPYEHPASYADDHVVSDSVKLWGNKKYVGVEHACLTFMTTKRALLANKRYFLIFSNWFGSDFVVWGTITLGFRYFKYLKLIFNPKKYNLENLKVYGSMWFFAWHRFLFNKKYRLYMPVGSFATHMEKNCLAPGIAWEKYFPLKKP